MHVVVEIHSLWQMKISETIGTDHQLKLNYYHAAVLTNGLLLYLCIVHTQSLDEQSRLDEFKIYSESLYYKWLETLWKWR